MGSELRVDGLRPALATRPACRARLSLGASVGPMHQRLTPVEDPTNGHRWLVDLDFLDSGWQCTWGDGCVGIGDQPDAASQLGCCSEGAQLLDDNEARWIATVAASLDPDRFHHHGRDTVIERDGKPHTSTVDGACVFFNPVLADAPTGCALHIGAVDDGDEPTDWKPSVCWQLPFKVERNDDHTVLRRWQRSDWGPGGETMAWCCSVDRTPDAFVAATPVRVRLRPELEALCGPDLLSAIETTSR